MTTRVFINKKEFYTPEYGGEHSKDLYKLDSAGSAHSENGSVYDPETGRKHKKYI